MKKFAFISRHTPTQEQTGLASSKGIELVPVGDLDAFSITDEQVRSFGHFQGVVVVHPAAALRLNYTYEVGIFENGQRTEEGKPASFFAKELHIFGRLIDVTA